MGIFHTVWQSISGVLLSIRLTDILDIGIISFLFYKMIQLVRETQAAQLVKGILLLILAYVAAVLFHLKTLGLILNNIFGWGILALIVLFQPELRRMLERVGRARVRGHFGFFTSKSESEAIIKEWERCIRIVVGACEKLSSTKTGALIVCERLTKLGEQIETGVIINADVCEELLLNLFFKNSPLHDGAVIIRDARILAASCFLPKPQKEELIGRDLGSRHRAAIGMSENSDALIIVVSEETGSVSVASNGYLKYNLSKTQLISFLRDRILGDVVPKNRVKKEKAEIEE